MYATEIMKILNVEEPSLCCSILLAIVHYKVETMSKQEFNLALLAIASNPKSTTNHAATIRKAIEMHAERAT